MFEGVREILGAESGGRICRKLWMMCRLFNDTHVHAHR